MRALVPLEETPLEPEDGSPSEATFDTLYAEHSRAIYNFVLRSTGNFSIAEDLCQEVWLKVHGHLDSLRDSEVARAWIYRIAQNTCRDAARRKTFTFVDSEFEPSSQRAEDDPSAAAVLRDDMRLAWQTLGALVPRQHMALFLREVEGRSYKEIAFVLETSESAVEALLFRARQALSQAQQTIAASKEERCRHASRLMALADGEVMNSVQQRALAAHLDECSSCQFESGRMRRASTAYAAMAFLPVPALLDNRVHDAIKMAMPIAPAAGLLARIVAAITGRAAAITGAGLVATTVAVSTVVVPMTFDSNSNDSTSAEVAVDQAAPTSSSSITLTAPPSGNSAQAGGTAVAGTSLPLVDTVATGLPLIDTVTTAVNSTLGSGLGVGLDGKTVDVQVPLPLPIGGANSIGVTLSVPTPDTRIGIPAGSDIVVTPSLSALPLPALPLPSVVPNVVTGQ